MKDEKENITQFLPILSKFSQNSTASAFLYLIKTWLIKYIRKYLINIFWVFFVSLNKTQLNQL